MSLPAWAQTAEARAIIEAILAERPDFTNDLCRNWGHRVLTYRGRNAADLRRIYDSHFEGPLTLAEADALGLGERPDELIGRLMRETRQIAVPYERVAFDIAPDTGRARFAA